MSVVLCWRTWRWQCSYTVWSCRLGNAMFSSATFKRECFPLASMSRCHQTREIAAFQALVFNINSLRIKVTAFAISQQKAKRLETAKFESSLKMVCILGEMLRESGVKLAEEMGCRMWGMVKRKLLCSAMSHTGFMVKVT